MRQICMYLTTVMAIATLAFPGSALSANNEKSPYLKKDESWISISGTAVDANSKSFTLDYGQGIVTVEMDPWDWYNKDYQNIEGHKVKVYGEVDDDTYETTTIEASSVYDESLGEYFIAPRAADEEAIDGSEYDYWMDADPIEPGEMTIRGTVSSEDGREFTIDTGSRKMTIDTSDMGYNPLDQKGYPQLDENDYVSVSGNMDDDTWEEQELLADTIIVLEDD